MRRHVRTFAIVFGLMWINMSPVLAQRLDPTFEDLARALHHSERPITSVEGLLAWLTRQHPRYMQHFALMHTSKSLQQSSTTHPRAIVFGERGELIIAFNGHPSHAGYNQLEVIDFDGELFEFREITFDPDGEGPPRISAPNPPKCARCHGASPHPLWGYYPNWPGAYGAHEDFLYEGGAEHGWFVRFKEQVWPRHPRYQHLTPLESGPTAPFQEHPFSGVTALRPNLRLSTSIARTQAAHVAALLKKRPLCYERHRELLVYTMLNCSNLEGDPTRSQFRYQVFTSYLANLYSSLVRHPFTHSPYTGQSQEIETVLLAMGVEQVDYASNFGATTWSEQQVDGSAPLRDYVVGILMKELARDKPIYQPHLRFRDDEARYGVADIYADIARPYLVSQSHDVCQTLSDSLQGDGAPQLTEETIAVNCKGSPSEEEVLARQTVDLCMSCHGRGHSAPYLPLRDKSLPLSDPFLFDDIQSRIMGVHRDGQMPPERRLSNRERKALLNYYVR